jgi:hypothetical protein
MIVPITMSATSAADTLGLLRFIGDAPAPVSQSMNGHTDTFGLLRFA